jgi:hypothetical protein
MHPLGYIDPGSGSLILQALLAAILAVPFMFRRTIGGFWQRLRGGAPVEEPAPSDVQPSDGPPSEH